jgi:hypothetical protein
MDPPYEAKITGPTCPTPLPLREGGGAAGIETRPAKKRRRVRNPPYEEGLLGFFCQLSTVNYQFSFPSQTTRPG